MLFPKSCVNFITTCLDYILFEFKDIIRAIYAFFLLAPSDPPRYSFLQGTNKVICKLGGWPQNYLTTHEAFWTSILYCFRPVVQFSREICSILLNCACEMSVVLVFDICNVYEIVALWLDVFTVLRSGNYGRYGCKISRKHLFLVC